MKNIVHQLSVVVVTIVNLFLNSFCQFRYLKILQLDQFVDQFLKIYQLNEFQVNLPKDILQISSVEIGNAIFERVVSKYGGNERWDI